MTEWDQETSQCFTNYQTVLSFWCKQTVLSIGSKKISSFNKFTQIFSLYVHTYSYFFFYMYVHWSLAFKNYCNFHPPRFGLYRSYNLQNHGFKINAHWCSDGNIIRDPHFCSIYIILHSKKNHSFCDLPKFHDMSIVLETLVPVSTSKSLTKERVHIVYDIILLIGLRGIDGWM